MSTFQFKDPNYVLSPPQKGTKAIINLLPSTDSTYKQDISNLPVTSPTNIRSVDPLALAYAALLYSAAGSITGLSTKFQQLLQHKLPSGRSVLELSYSGFISSGDALLWLRVATGSQFVTEAELKHAQDAEEFLGQHYKEFKDETVISTSGSYKIFISEPVDKTGSFDSTRHYIVADASDPVDRLKLVKYNYKTNFNHSYWFDAGTGSETEGLNSLEFTVSKKANTSKLISNTLSFDGSSSSVIDVANNKFTISDHGFQNGDFVYYERGRHLSFDSSDTSIVSVANNTITIAGHGYSTDDVVLYTVKDGDIPIAPFGEGTTRLTIEKIDNDTFKLITGDDGGPVVDITGVGLGIHSFSGVVPGWTALTYRSGKSTYYINRIDDDNFRLSNSKADALSDTFLEISSLGVGKNHSLRPNYLEELETDDFIAVSEEVTFEGNSSNGINTTTDVITTDSAHGYSTGDSTRYVRASQTPTVPGLVNNALYFVIKVSDTSLKLAYSHTQALAGTALSLTGLASPGDVNEHKFVLEYGTKVYRVDESTIYTSTSDDVVITNRALKKPNWKLDPAQDIALAKVFKFTTAAEVKTTESVATTNHTLTKVVGQKFKIGATITSGIAGNPKITAVTFTDSLSESEATISIDSPQTAVAGTTVEVTSVEQETYYHLDSGDRLEDDSAPKLSENLNLNSKSISDGTVSVSSFRNRAQRIAADPSDSSLPTSAAVRDFVSSATFGGGHPLTTSTASNPTSFTYDGTFTGQDTFVAGTYTGISTAYHSGLNPDTSGTGGEVTIVVASDKTVTSVTATTAGSGYKVGDEIIVQASSLGGSTNGDLYNLRLRVNQINSVAGTGTVDTSGTPAANQFARFTDADTIEGRTASEVLSDIGAQAALTFGIANDNAVEIDSASVADDDYAKFTANGLEGRNASEVKTDLSLNNVTNESKSTMFANPAFTGTTTVEQLTGDVPTLASATQNAGSSGTVMNQTILNSSVENGSLAMLNTINELAGFDKWGTIQNVSNFYSTRTGSPGSYSYSSAIAADNSGWEKAFDGTSGTAGSWFTDDGASGTDFTSNKATFELHFNSVKELAYTCYAGIVFGSGSFIPSQLKIEAYTGGAYHTLCDLTNNTDVVVARRVNNQGTNGLERLRFTMNGNPTSGNGYIRIQEIFAVDHDAGNNTTRHKGRYFMHKYQDDYHFGDLFPGTDSTYDLGSASYAYANTHTDKLFLHDTVGTGSSALGLVLDGNEVKTRGLGSNAYLSKNYGIADNNAVDIDDADVTSGDYARFTAFGVEGRSASEVKTDLSLDNVENTAISTFAGSANITTVGTVSSGTWQGTAIADDYISSASTWNAKQDALTFGIADTNTVVINDTDVEATDYAKFTTTGLQGRSAAEVASDISAVVTNADNTIATDKKIQFRDSGSYINSSAANILDLVADARVSIDAPTLKIQTTETANTSAPSIDIEKVDSSPADGSALAALNFRGNTDTTPSVTYSQISSTTDDVTHASANGSILVRTVNDGTLETVTTTNKDGLKIDSSADLVLGGSASTIGCGGTAGNIVYTASIGHFFTGANLEVKDSLAGQNVAPAITITKDDTGTPVDGDLIGAVQFKGDTSTGNDIYSYIEARAEDVSSLTTDGSLVFSTKVNSAKTEHLKIEGGEVRCTNSRLGFQNDTVDSTRGDTPNIAFELLTGSHGNHAHSSVLVLDDRTYLNAYGLMLADNQGTGSFSTTASRYLVTYSGGAHRLYSNDLLARTNSAYFLKLYTTGVGLNLRGSISLDDTRYIGFGNSTDSKIYYNGTSSINNLYLELEAAANNFVITDNGTTRFTFAKSSGDFTATGNVTAYSDERLKSDIKTLDPSKTLQMRGVEFTKDGKKGSGVIAQELEKVAPELVLDKGDYKSVAYGNLTGYLIETVKEQQKQIDELKDLVQKLMEKV